MTLDAATSSLLAQMRERRAAPLWELSLAEARAMMAATEALRGPAPVMDQVRDVRIPVSGGVVKARVYTPRPSSAAPGVIVYLHGGGWVIGSVADYDNLTRRLAAMTGCVVVSVDYRLAPEYRFPTAVDDSWTALLWVAARVEELAGATVPLIIAGDSAGGNLAAVMSLKARDNRGPALALQVLIYPVTDCDLTTTSYRDPANDLMLNAQAMAWFWDQYVADPAARTHPHVSPLRSPVVNNVAPAVILTAEHDVLRDEGELYATRLMHASVPVQHRRFAGQMHGFLGMLDMLPASADALICVADAVKQRLTELK